MILVFHIQLSKVTSTLSCFIPLQAIYSGYCAIFHACVTYFELGKRLHITDASAHLDPGILVFTWGNSKHYTHL